jgi:CheY-like chemotaxis protein
VAFGVNDTGSGMTPDVLAHALEPFFTTKGAGNGLGLSMVYGFVNQSGGGMSIDSRPGYGTSVDFLLPIASASTGSTIETRGAHGAQAGERRTILVVEDEADVRTIAARFLSANGYQVVAAACAREALDLLAANPDVDLIFSDLVLGSGMNGVELAHEACRMRPGLAVLLTSGYQGKYGGTESPTAPFELLRKPYRREQLVEAVRRLLDAA